ncbi:MAG: hypothetical protein WDO17_11255 [Alphaproteobacteria bacterium]
MLGGIMRSVAVVGVALLLSDCASKSSDITPAYVSPIMYQNHTCAQLAQEAQGVSARAAQVSGAQDAKRTNDAVATGVAIVVFWPAAFLVSGDGPTAAELGQLKGQMVAIEQASIQKNCAISFQRTAETGGPVVTQVQAPPPAVAASSKQTASVKRAQAKQLPAPAAQTTVIVAEPPTPTLSESDRTMMQRN